VAFALLSLEDGERELYASSGVKYDYGRAKSSFASWSRLRKFLFVLLLLDIYNIRSSGKMHIDAPISRLLANPLIMATGMTPTIFKAGFVSAILGSGFHIEPEGGRHYNANALCKKFAEI
jgi:hypothetical protein